MKAKRTFKDSLFRYMFNNKKRLADLYEALTGRAVSPREIKITTLRGVFMSDIKNDIGFRIGNRFIILMEHQSTWNPNMALRMLWYIAKLYHRQVGKGFVYHSNLVKIPAPEFYVFYNGQKEEPPFQKLRLSDAFEGGSDALELVVNCCNINYSEHNKLLDRCYELRCYSIFVQKTREYYAECHDLKKAIRMAIAYCEEHDLMAEFFEANENEVLDMVNFNWDQNRAIEVAKEEGIAEGEARGEARGMVKGEARGEKKGRRNLLIDLVRDGLLSLKDAAKRAGVSEETFRKMAAL